MSNADDGWIAPNQRHGILAQLHDGVRALMIDTHVDDQEDTPVPSLCHGSCVFGAVLMVEALARIASFLWCNPEQIVTLIITPWPTLD